MGFRSILVEVHLLKFARMRMSVTMVCMVANRVCPEQHVRVVSLAIRCDGAFINPSIASRDCLRAHQRGAKEISKVGGPIVFQRKGVLRFADFVVGRKTDCGSARSVGSHS